MSNDTGSNTLRHSKPDSSSSYNNFQSSKELQMRELKPLTYGGKDIPVDTKNTPTTIYANRIQCERFNAGGLKS